MAGDTVGKRIVEDRLRREGLLSQLLPLLDIGLVREAARLADPYLSADVQEALRRLQNLLDLALLAVLAAAHRRKGLHLLPLDDKEGLDVQNAAHRRRSAGNPAAALQIFQIFHAHIDNGEKGDFFNFLAHLPRREPRLAHCKRIQNNVAHRNRDAARIRNLNPAVVILREEARRGVGTA